MTEQETIDEVIRRIRRKLDTLESNGRIYANHLADDFNTYIAKEAKYHYKDNAFRTRLQRFLMSLDAYGMAKGENGVPDYSRTPKLLTEEVRRLERSILDADRMDDDRGAMEQLTYQWECDARMRYYRFIAGLAEYL
jgi:hypothetical protein